MEIIRVKVNTYELRNPLHFKVQLTTRGEVFRNRKAYHRPSIKRNYRKDMISYE